MVGERAGVQERDTLITKMEELIREEAGGGPRMGGGLRYKREKDVLRTYENGGRK